MKLPKTLGERQEASSKDKFNPLTGYSSINNLPASLNSKTLNNPFTSNTMRADTNPWMGTRSVGTYTKNTPTRYATSNNKTILENVLNDKSIQHKLLLLETYSQLTDVPEDDVIEPHHPLKHSTELHTSDAKKNAGLRYNKYLTTGGVNTPSWDNKTVKNFDLHHKFSSKW